MTRRIKHIALLLALFFFFPLAYQTVHILTAHAGKDNHVHACCGSCSDKPPVSENEDEEQQTCPVCNYHFFCFVLNDLSFDLSAVPFIAAHLLFSQPEIPEYFVGYHNSLRAPPCTPPTLA